MDNFKKVLISILMIAAIGVSVFVIVLYTKNTEAKEVKKDSDVSGDSNLTEQAQAQVDKETAAGKEQNTTTQTTTNLADQKLQNEKEPKDTQESKEESKILDPNVQDKQVETILPLQSSVPLNLEETNQEDKIAESLQQKETEPEATLTGQQQLSISKETPDQGQNTIASGENIKPLENNDSVNSNVESNVSQHNEGQETASTGKGKQDFVVRETTTAIPQSFDAIIQHSLSYSFERTADGKTFLIFPIEDLTDKEFQELQQAGENNSLQQQWTQELLTVGSQLLQKEYLCAITSKGVSNPRPIIIPSSDSQFVKLFYTKKVKCLEGRVGPLELFQLIYRSIEVFRLKAMLESTSKCLKDMYREAYSNLQINIGSYKLAVTKKSDKNKLVSEGKPLNYDGQICCRYLEYFFANESNENILRDKIENIPEYDKYLNFFKRYKNPSGTLTIINQKENPKIEFTLIDYLIYVDRKWKKHF